MGKISDKSEIQASYSTKNMGTWHQRLIKKKGKGSQTPGKTKVESCQADFKKRYMAKKSRSYKDSEYKEWCRQVDILNNIKR